MSGRKEMSEVRKRQFTRIPVSRRVLLDFQGKRYGPCRLKDLSLGGLFVYSRFAEQEGACCLVTLTQKGRGLNLIIKAAGRVVRGDREGMAIEFTSMATDSYMSLQTMLLYSAEDPFSLSLEFPVDDCPFTLTEIAPAKPKQIRAAQ